MRVNVIKEIMSITKEAESPRSWVYWSVISAISAVVGRKVYKNMGGVYTIYPNLYVMLVGDSGLRKSFPITVAETLISQVKDTRILMGMNTIQAMISNLARAHTLEDGTVIKEAKAAIISEEFGTLLVKDEKCEMVLTTWYDTGKDEWTNDTKKSGRETIYKPYISIFGASNQTNLRLALSQASITGGLIGRFIFIEEFKRYKHNPLTKSAPPIDYSLAIESLKEISLIEGEMNFSDDAEKEFIAFYEDLGKKIDSGGDPTGTINRLHVKVVKVAMIIALTEGHGLTIQKEDVEFAIKSCLEYSGIKIWSGVGISEDSMKISLLMETLRKAEGGQLEKSVILRKHYGDFSIHDLGKMVDTLVASGLVESIIRDNKAIVRITELGWAFLDASLKKGD